MSDQSNKVIKNQLSVAKEYVILFTVNIGKTRTVYVFFNGFHGNTYTHPNQIAAFLFWSLAGSMGGPIFPFEGRKRDVSESQVNYNLLL